jgi:solute carrier family 41
MSQDLSLLTKTGKQDWLAPLIISGYILVTPLWVWIAKKNKHTHEVLYTGWTPVMAAMLISR